MSSAVSNLSTLTLAFPSQKRLGRAANVELRRRPVNHGLWCVSAKAGEGTDNLDHLKRAGRLPQQQQQQPPPSQPPKRRISQSAPIGLWDRFPTARTVQQMMDTMERIMEDPFVYSGVSFPSLTDEESLGGYRRGRTPWEIKEAEGEYKMRFDMPGMTKTDVKMWVEEKMLVIKAEKQPKEGKNGKQEEEWSVRSYGQYNSRIALPDNVMIEKIKAEVRDGVLYITIPKATASNKVLDINVQ